eukprot:6342866-Prymnesium_polylepis.1
MHEEHTGLQGKADDQLAEIAELAASLKARSQEVAHGQATLEQEQRAHRATFFRLEAAELAQEEGRKLKAAQEEAMEEARKGHQEAFDEVTSKYNRLAKDKAVLDKALNEITGELRSEQRRAAVIH